MGLCHAQLHFKWPSFLFSLRLTPALVVLAAVSCSSFGVLEWKIDFSSTDVGQQTIYGHVLD